MFLPGVKAFFGKLAVIVIGPESQQGQHRVVLLEPERGACGDRTGTEGDGTGGGTTSTCGDPLWSTNSFSVLFSLFSHQASAESVCVCVCQVT